MLSALARRIFGYNLPDTLIEVKSFMDNEDPAFKDSEAVEPATLDSSSRTASILAAYDIQKAF